MTRTPVLSSVFGERMATHRTMWTSVRTILQHRPIRSFEIRCTVYTSRGTPLCAFASDVHQKFLLLADGENNVIWTVRRDDGVVVGQTGHSGRNAGQFHWVH